MKQKLFYLIKITSTVLITCALALEIWYIYVQFTGALLPHQLYPLLWLGSIALVAHVIEGALAAVKANSQDKHPITYGIYTFFVGFVGLWELQSILSEAKRHS